MCSFIDAAPCAGSSGSLPVSLRAGAFACPRLVDDRAIDNRAQLFANRVGGGRTHLGHEHDGEVLCGRDPERCGGGSAPVVLAWDAEPAEHGGVENARKAEAETHAL